MSEIIHGFYSKKQSEVTERIFVYELFPSREQVFVTQVQTNNSTFSSNYEDVKYVGIVKKYVKKIQLKS